MNKFETIFLHIGLHKTGSTTIQHTLHNYREELAASHALFYPAFARNHSVPLVAMYHDQPHTYRMNILSGIDTAEAAEEFAATRRAAFETEMQQSQSRQMLLSGEDVSDLSVAGLERLHEWLMQWTDDLRIVAMVRNPIKWAVSAAQSNIRGGKTYAQANKRLTLLRLGDRLQKFLDTFGRDQMTVFSLEEAAQHPAGLTACMLEKLGLPAAEFPNESKFNQNPGMSLEAAQLISALNRRRPLIIDGKLNPRRFDGDVLPIIRGIKGQPFRLESDTMVRIRESALADKQWLEQNFGMELALDLNDGSAATTTDTLTFSMESVENLALKLHELNQIQQLEKKR
ncbi:MAG: hypothetical protein ABJ308_08560 [Halieaceae bacterium]